MSVPRTAMIVTAVTVAVAVDMAVVRLREDSAGLGLEHMARI